MKFWLALFLLISPLRAHLLEDAQSLYKEIKCPVCAGQSIEDSPMDEAVFLREYVLEKLQKGQTPEEIREDLRREFGDDILFAPPFNRHTALLWGLPLLLALGLGGFMVRRLKLKKIERN